MKCLRAYFRKLVPLRAQDTTARVVLERTIDKADRIKSVAIVIHWDDDTFALEWSTMQNGTFACMAILLNQEAQKSLVARDSNDSRP